ncbi:MAG TPA: LptF/LptG family permease, partial [Isosphaeraceae bacterium]|nr:LptF/LptG family permease [Isosphaeraceae bacterium]
MWILDRQRCGDFFKAYLICFGSLVGLYIVIDAFSNVDEFYKVEEKTLAVFRLMGHYYLVRIPMMYDRLCGVITMMAAIFTATWVQRNNELLAMLAAGVSTYRVIVPIVLCAALVSLIGVANQELLIPIVSEEVQKTPDDDGKRGLKIFSKRDVNQSVIGGNMAFRDLQVVEPFNAVFSARYFGDMQGLDA